MKYNSEEFYKIIDDIYNNEEFKKLDNYKHHGITRYRHSMRVSYYTYLVTKKLGLNYKSATRAALLHDFFTDEVKKVNVFLKITRHPRIAVDNSKKYFDINELEEDIIRTHMFPCTIRPPKYLESWIVDAIDDLSAIGEVCSVMNKNLRAVASFVFMFVISKF